MSTRLGAAAVRSVESILEHGQADLERQRRALGDKRVAEMLAWWDALPAPTRRYLSTRVANGAAEALLKVVRQADDDEATDRAQTPICPACGGAVTRRCGMCGWWDGIAGHGGQ